MVWCVSQEGNIFNNCDFQAIDKNTLTYSLPVNNLCRHFKLCRHSIVSSAYGQGNRSKHLRHAPREVGTCVLKTKWQISSRDFHTYFTRLKHSPLNLLKIAAFIWSCMEILDLNRLGNHDCCMLCCHGVNFPSVSNSTYFSKEWVCV